MTRIHVETVVETDGELTVRDLPCRKGDRVEAIVLINDAPADDLRNLRRSARQRYLARRAVQRSAPPALTPRASSFMIVLDTNIWIYSHDSRDPRKQAVAQQLIADVAPLALPWQVGCEFVAAARKLANAQFTEADAWLSLEDMRQMADVIALPDVSDWPAARGLQSSDGLSFWDAVLLANCQRHGVRTVYSEDMGSPRTVQGIQLLNPFL